MKEKRHVLVAFFRRMYPIRHYLLLHISVHELFDGSSKENTIRRMMALGSVWFDESEIETLLVVVIW